MDQTENIEIIETTITKAVTASPAHRELLPGPGYIPVTAASPNLEILDEREVAFTAITVPAGSPFSCVIEGVGTMPDPALATTMIHAHAKPFASHHLDGQWAPLTINRKAYGTSARQYSLELDTTNLNNGTYHIMVGVPLVLNNHQTGNHSVHIWTVTFN